MAAPMDLALTAETAVAVTAVVAAVISLCAER